MMRVLLLIAGLGQGPVCSGEAADRIERAVAAGEAFDLRTAAELFERAAILGCDDAALSARYLRGWLAAAEAARQGGDPLSLEPVRQAAADLERRAAGRPGVAEIARLLLTAAAAAAQSERGEMALFLDQALHVESLQRAAGEPLLPLLAADEAAGDLWLQVHRYEEARAAYVEAARHRITPRIMLGLARAARRLMDVAAACFEYRRLEGWWGGRPDPPGEVLEARAYLQTPGCA